MAVVVFQVFVVLMYDDRVPAEDLAWERSLFFVAGSLEVSWTIRKGDIYIQLH